MTETRVFNWKVTSLVAFRYNQALNINYTGYARIVSSAKGRLHKRKWEGEEGRGLA
jgi:hypothetical protein